MQLYDGLTTRRSVREFTDQVLDDKGLEKIVRAGMFAPSPHDTRPWRILTIRDHEKLEKLIPLSPWWNMLRQCQAAIVTCVDIRCAKGENSEKELMPVEFVIDGGIAATQNMLLAAHDMGLGAVWLGICQGSESYEEFCRILGIPDYARVVSLIAVGYPDSEPNQEERFDPSKWIKETWK